MAKQTFTTGQVLTAAQMTSLQETAMGGGPATAKTASYVLVAADAGTTVAMNAAGATTITVNTGLFAAGDTVFIQNLGAGACTVTAGTATVATAGSLILPQNDAGILYFTATGAAIFYDYIQAGAVSPLTTKGDLYGFSTSDARIPIGTNNQVLTADSAQALGLKWATPSASATAWTQLASGTSLSGSSTTISGLSGYNQLLVMVRYADSNTNGDTPQITFNSDTASNYRYFEGNITEQASSLVSVSNNAATSSAYFQLASLGGSSSTVAGYFLIDGANSTGTKTFTYSSAANAGGGNGNRSNSGAGFYVGTSVISSVTFSWLYGSATGGSLYIYGGN